MAWQMPPTGQWGMPMTPDVNAYSSEQWAAMQQQNWQQWAQWQQQYAQWQSQYGDKYAQQMQVMQSMGNMGPPLPGSAPPPAPPPPAQPPPEAQPPPHENNQPLYAAPVQPPSNTILPNPIAPPTQTAPQTGNQWSYNAPPPADTTPLAANSDALVKLAEEEKLFDIQFQKWEEEIDKWRQENVNHPDKQAYKEYEQKFETCRAQLLERRRQMNLKRARLMKNAPAVNTPLPGNAPKQTPPQPITSKNNYSHNSQQQQHFNIKQNQSGYNQNAPYHRQQYNNASSSSSNCNKGNVDPQDRFESYNDLEEDMDYSNNGNFSSNDNYNNDYSSNNDYPIDDNYPANNDYPGNDEYPPNDDYPPDKVGFLPTSGNSKSIPGLDLVPEVEKPRNQQQDVIDITEEYNKKNYNESQKGPDYSKISKGINNILGDEKIMNILSMVRVQNVPPPDNNAQNAGNNMPYRNQNNQMNNQRDRSNNDYNQQQQYGNRQNNTPYYNKDRQDSSNYSMQQNQGQNNRFPPNNQSNQKNVQGDRFNVQSGNQDRFDENSHYGGSSMHQRTDIPPPRMNVPPPKPLMEIPFQQPNNNSFDCSRPPPIRGASENILPSEPPKKRWIEDPMFTPSLIVEYEHKALRIKARDFIEPVHMFEYDHKSKDGETKKRDFEKEADELFSRNPRRDRDMDFMPQGRYDRDQYSRDFERRVPRDSFRDDRHRGREEYDRRRGPFPAELDPERRRPEDYDKRRSDDNDRRRSDDNDRRRSDDNDRRRPDVYERRRPDDHDDRRRDDRYSRRDDNFRDNLYRDSFKDISRKDDHKPRSRSRERESRKRDHSRDSQSTDSSKKSREKDGQPLFDPPKHLVMIDDILEPPGRNMRPDKIVIILRGPPGSGKSYLAKLIRDKEAEHGGTARIMSIDDYFMQEGESEETDPTTGKIVKKPTLKYEFDENSEEVYLNSLTRAFKRSLTDGYFNFLLYDAVNDHLRSYADVWNFARQNGFQVYVCTMDLDPHVCFKRNIHNRSLDEIQVICSRFFPTPGHHIQLDATTLLQSAAITEVHMEDVDDDDVIIMEDAQDHEVETVFTSKWEKMDDATQLARLDGTSKPLRPSQVSMEDYLQLDEWTPNKAKPGKKTVRWADIEERREQEKMRAIGFVVGQTDWNRMTDPTMGSSALTQTKYIERVRRN